MKNIEIVKNILSSKKLKKDITFIHIGDIHYNETTSTKKLEVEEDIKYTTEEIKETNMLKGKKETVEVGENGQKKITYKVTYDKNNKEISASWKFLR